MLGRLVLGGITAALLWPLVRRFWPPPERLQITSPTALSMVSSPISVTGVGQAVQHNELGLRVRDESGAEIGTGVASVSGALGARGPFSGSITYVLGGPSQPGRLEVFDTSPRDGGLIHLSSVELTLT